MCGALMGWSQAQQSDVPGPQLAMGFVASMYFLRSRKGLPLSRAALLSTATLFAGCGLGAALEGWLRVDIVPFAGISSPSALVSEVSLLSLLASCLLLA